MAVEHNHFASDNYAGICPEALAALQTANTGHVRAYGEDPWTARAANLFRETFEADCDVFFVFNGTAANALALACLCQSYHSVICNDTAHIETDECGATEFFTHGAKLLHSGCGEGKLQPDAVRRLVTKRSDIHYPKPRALSVTQATELGTVYTRDELRALHDTARECGLRIHMDGARFANACVTLGASPGDLSWRCGVDILCLGGTKNGMILGEAILFFDRALSREFGYRCKQAGQLASKMRFLAAPWIGMLEAGAWERHARHANRQAQRLAQRLSALDGISLMFPVEANAVFVDMPASAREKLAQTWHFYTFIGVGGARFLCAWDTTDEDIDALVEDVAACLETTF